MPKRITIVTHFNQSGYSGGRYYVLMLACALAEKGHEVTLHTNCIPEMHREFVHFKSYSQIKWHFGNGIAETEDSRTDCVIAVPQLNENVSGYLLSLKLAKDNNSALVLLDFETPVWFNSMSSSQRREEQYKGPRALSISADLILSISKIGMEKAKEYYKNAHSQCGFDYVYPGVNTPALEGATSSKFRDTVLFSTRLAGAKHKNANLILDLLPKTPKDVRLVIIVDDSREGRSFSLEAEKLAKRNGLLIEMKTRISDLEKFSELARARLVVITSEFEGYGYPLVEAMHASSPVICFDLPVFRELVDRTSANVKFVPIGDTDALQDCYVRLVRKNPSKKGHKPSTAAIQSRFDVFSEILSKKIESLEPFNTRGREARNVLLAESMDALSNEPAKQRILNLRPSMSQLVSAVINRLSERLRPFVERLKLRPVDTIYALLPRSIREKLHEIRLKIKGNPK